MNYTLHQLQVFYKVVQLKSITKASEELHMTQPAVSIQLKNFQDQFDIPLTEVIGRQLYITDFGKEISEAAEKILNEVYAINYKTAAYKGELSGKLKISIVSTGKYVMPFFLSKFINQNPGVELSLDVTNKAKVIESIENNEVDFSLVSVLPDKLQIGKLELLQNKLFLVGNNRNDYKLKQYDKNVFADLPLIYREKGSGTRSVMEKFLEKNKIKTTKKMELSTNEAVKQAVIAGIGYSIMPLIGIKNELINKDLKIIPVKNFPVKSMWHLIWPKNKNFSPAAKAFLNHLKEEKNQIVKDQFDWYENY